MDVNEAHRMLRLLHNGVKGLRFSPLGWPEDWCVLLFLRNAGYQRGWQLVVMAPPGALANFNAAEADDIATLNSAFDQIMQGCVWPGAPVDIELTDQDYEMVAEIQSIDMTGIWAEAAKAVLPKFPYAPLPARAGSLRRCWERIFSVGTSVRKAGISLGLIRQIARLQPLA